VVEDNESCDSWVAYCKLCEYIQGVNPSLWPYHLEAFVNAIRDGETPHMSLVISQKLFVQSPNDPDIMVEDEIS